MSGWRYGPAKRLARAAKTCFAAAFDRLVRCHLFHTGTERVEVDGVTLTPIASLYRGR